MMSDIDRPDWNYSAPTKGYEQPLPDSKALVPASPRALVAEMEAWTPETGVQVAWSWGGYRLLACARVEESDGVSRADYITSCHTASADPNKAGRSNQNCGMIGKLSRRRDRRIVVQNRHRHALRRPQNRDFLQQFSLPPS